MKSVSRPQGPHVRTVRDCQGGVTPLLWVNQVDPLPSSDPSHFHWQMHAHRLLSE